ncbi:MULTISPECIES: copper resistance system multicopper oxidase [unclassified Phenylobacterium]|uniref:copper resistance system multicopper oxidase n=1 Tax=unclassified Phenylobacterium TaxID=2640670 RepID=UPI0008B7F843|nr:MULTISPECIES: copper resistance system multicopper oxidase [unclassified Phenylobacterium]MBA4793408.1 copper resistance system multicopper oxidase [Phenylobacterium sp.]MCR5880124.1 copper resistance system multicopper oxidase [Phenylobacterium sp. J367]OHB26666.1 MAG: copper resistance protein CopA [Phenylobacterium sp. RIFCSPHIGHO2_01_FULL_69_31]
MFGSRELISRRAVLAAGGGLGLSAALARAAPAYARTSVVQAALAPVAGTRGQRALDLEIGHFQLMVGDRPGRAMAINQTIPGPLLRFREGEEAVLRVTNRLEEIASIHWHGIILPPAMDGVPGVSFGGIAPGETFTYRFPLLQSGTYWCHSHSGGQELLGVYAPFIIDPAAPEPFAYERDYVVMLSDWSFEPPEQIIKNLKKQAGYYNYQKRTVADLFRDAARDGWPATLRERLSWTKMRMDPTDFADVTGYTYTYLVNGLTANANWTGLFTRGERVRLRFIAAGAMTYFDIRIPGLKMTVVQADGQNVQPVDVDEFRIGPGETFDVIVTPDDQAYTLFAEAMDRSGFARGTLAPRAGMTAPIPPRRKRPLRTMADMGMDMSGMEMSGDMAGMPGMSNATASPKAPVMGIAGHAAGDIAAVERNRAAVESQVTSAHAHGAVAANGASSAMAHMGTPLAAKPGVAPTFIHGPDTHGVGNSSVAMVARSRLHEPGSGFDDPAARVLVYADLRSVTPQEDQRTPTREIELHITGNMERYMWSFDGKKYSEARAPIPFAYGERLRLVLVNDTMMEHPIHLHGMWMELENGAGAHQPRKHTVSVKPAERLTVAITADAPGQWAMHCHLLLHMEMGMFRVIEVSSPPQ